MAKKRVHELAKQYDMPTSEVIKRLNAAGLEVKAAATAVDEKLADAALTGKPKPKAKPKPKPAAGGPRDGPSLNYMPDHPAMQRLDRAIASLWD